MNSAEVVKVRDKISSDCRIMQRWGNIFLNVALDTHIPNCNPTFLNSLIEFDLP